MDFMNTSSLNQTDTTTTAMQDTLTFNDMPERSERRDVIYRAPQPWLQKAEAFLERTCKFEHGANIFPFLHIVLFYMALAFLEFGVFDSLWLNVPIWIGLVLANYSLSIGIPHLHTHRKMFTVPWLNRVTEILLTLPGGVSHPVMKYIHVHLHHRYDDGPCRADRRGRGSDRAGEGRQDSGHVIEKPANPGPCRPRGEAGRAGSTHPVTNCA